MASRSVEVQLWPDCRYASRHTTPKARNAGKGNLIPNLTGLSGPASKRPRRAATTPRRPRPAPSSSSSKGRLQLRAQRTVAGCRGRMGAWARAATLCAKLWTGSNIQPSCSDPGRSCGSAEARTIPGSHTSVPLQRRAVTAASFRLR